MSTGDWITIIVCLLGYVGACIGAYIHLYTKVAVLETKLESFIDSIGRNAAKIAHRDDDKHEIDNFLDTYMRKEDLPFEDWQRLEVITKKLMNDETKDKDSRTAFGLLNAVCHHKMQNRSHFPPNK